MEDFLTRLRNNILALVAVILLVASAPVITLIVAIVCSLDDHPDPNYAVALTLGGPAVCAFWYMFIARMTRAARAKLEFSSERRGFHWALGRLFGGWFLSQLWSFAVLFVVGLLRERDQDTPSYILFPSLSLAVWAPVIINLSRHFARKSRLEREWRESQPRIQQQKRREEQAKQDRQRELERERKLTSEKYGDVARRFSSLVTVCAAPWEEFLKIKSALGGDDSPRVPFKTAIEFDLYSILKTASRATGGVTLDLADLCHAVISELSPDEWHSIAECKKRFESFDELRFQMPTVIGFMAVVDKPRNTHFANAAASAYYRLVLAATANFKKSAALESVRLAYFGELTPYLSSDTEASDHYSSEDSSAAGKDKASGITEDCALLGIDEYYTLEELSAARRTKAAQWHPDKLETMAPELKEYATRQLARLNGAYERLEKLVKWNSEPKSLRAEGEEAAAIVQKVNCDLANLNRELRQILDSGHSPDVSGVESKMEKIAERFDDGIRRMRTHLARARKEAPTMDVTSLEQTISDAINTSRRMKSNAEKAAAGS
ncbi:MAG TPA: hypothetical protein VMG82_03850 [Candidatus Sulfotelmatobacter sp.]|nr:hypothetical protein [Candidatus Sulfotelmatobacter sp.]